MESDGEADGPSGGGPPCAICARVGEGPRRLVHLTHGVSVWLCHTHGSDRFLRDGDGTVFTQRLLNMWLATGCLTARRAAALRTHVRRLRAADAARDRPGSYSWPELRREAERRFAAGHDPRVVIAELRDRHADCPAMAPSVRTMRRWYTQARWLTPPPRGRRGVARPRGRRHGIPAQYALIPAATARYLPREYVDPIWRGT